jgi:hypothetical protein
MLPCVSHQLAVNSSSSSSSHLAEGAMLPVHLIVAVAVAAAKSSSHQATPRPR